MSLNAINVAGQKEETVLETLTQFDLGLEKIKDVFKYNFV